MPAAKKAHEAEPETEHNETVEQAETPAPKQTKNTAKTDSVSELVALAEKTAEGFSGATKVFHDLDVAFVHGLNGAKSDAEKALDLVDAEIAKFAPNLDHLIRDVSLAKARVLAALGRK